ncbi:hypothetical protein TrVGV298_002685 [Trichoderma virens]|nr:hypothetical protein TrVGV298_002685 [Trichoderma virens]
MAEALGLVSSIIAVVDLFAKVGVLCSAYCSGLKNAPQDIRHILNEADRFTATLSDLKKLLESPNGAKLNSSQNVRRSVADCRLQLKDLITKLEQGTSLQKITSPQKITWLHKITWLERISWPLKKGEVDGILHKLQKYRMAIVLDLQADQTALLLDVHQEVVLKS